MWYRARTNLFKKLARICSNHPLCRKNQNLWQTSNIWQPVAGPSAARSDTFVQVWTSRPLCQFCSHAWPWTSGISTLYKSKGSCKWATRHNAISKLVIKTSRMKNFKNEPPSFYCQWTMSFFMLFFVKIYVRKSISCTNRLLTLIASHKFASDMCSSTTSCTHTKFCRRCTSLLRSAFYFVICCIRFTLF